LTIACCPSLGRLHLVADHGEVEGVHLISVSVVIGDQDEGSRERSGCGFGCAFVRSHVAPLEAAESTRERNARAIGKATNNRAFR